MCVPAGMTQAVTTMTQSRVCGQLGSERRDPDAAASVDYTEIPRVHKVRHS